MKPLHQQSVRARFNAIQAAPFGAIGVRIEDDAIAELVFLEPGLQGPLPSDALAREAYNQIAAFFRDPRHVFDLPLKPAGTDFQRRVWRAISAVHCGSTRSYGDLARELGSAARAVGQACGANVYPLVFPCHRVVSADGLGGFAHHAGGFHTGVKRWLLARELGSIA